MVDEELALFIAPLPSVAAAAPELAGALRRLLPMLRPFVRAGASSPAMVEAYEAGIAALRVARDGAPPS